jgi:hypothetical protein
VIDDFILRLLPQPRKKCGASGHQEHEGKAANQEQIKRIKVSFVLLRDLRGEGLA